MNACVDILSPGLLTTVQDLGRWGHQSRGVSVAGPMDPHAHRLANVLVANRRDLATLEVTLTGPTLVFRDARAFAVTGADFSLVLDEQPVPMNQSVSARAGAVLRFGERRAGARAYLAVSGGFDVPVLLGSRATHLPTAMGGWQGRALRRDDRLPLGPYTSSDANHTLPTPATHVHDMTASPARAAVVRVLPGPHEDRFVAGAFDCLLSEPYRVDPASNRMGYRLTGPAIAHRQSADILSEATPLGTVQVPASGQPVLLMADRQTAGGYAKIATVISADIGVAGQVAPGETIRFVSCTPADAIGAFEAREHALLALESRFV